MHHRGREVLGNAIYDNISPQRVHARSAGRPEEIARSIVLLCSNDASYITAPLRLSDFSIDRYIRHHLA
jgi:NAD(P)-dependent dehydrogenase (short-subunit alcohol dehydrogenase family)